MKIGKFTTIMVAAASIFTACERGSLQKLSGSSLERANLRLAPAIDYFNKEGQKVLSDNTYKLFGRDTICISSPWWKNGNIVENYNGVVEDIQSSATEKMPQVITGSHIEKDVKDGDTISRVVLDPTNLFVDTKAIAKKEFFVSKHDDIFVPVEFYGKKNTDPKLNEARK